MEIDLFKYSISAEWRDFGAANNLLKKVGFMIFSLFRNVFFRTFRIWGYEAVSTIDDFAELPCASRKEKIGNFHAFLTICGSKNRQTGNRRRIACNRCHKVATSFRLPKSRFICKILCVRAICEHEDDWKTQVNTDCGNRFWTTFVRQSVLDAP